MGSVWDVMATGTYWVLVVLWTFILVFCIQRVVLRRIANRLVILLLVVLAIDAVRTVAESVYFGLWYTSLIGYLPAEVGNFLTRSDVLFYPKLLNLLAAIIIIFIVLRRWLPQEERELALEAQRSADLEDLVDQRTRDWNEAVRQLESEVDRQRVLMNELDHRVKNNLASIIAMTQLSLTGSDELVIAQGMLLNRLHAMARAYDALAESRWSAVLLRTIAERCVYAYAHREMNVTISGPDVQLAPPAVSPLGLILNELTTNAIRHGALSQADGSLRLTWRIGDDGDLVITWRERTSRPIEAPSRVGYGLELVRGLVQHDLQGVIDHEFRVGGFDAQITVSRDCLRREQLDSGDAVVAQST